MTPDTLVSLWPDPNALGLATDLYQLTMMAGYEASGHWRKRATFEMFVRRMPEERAFLVFAGLEQAVDDILRLRVSSDQLDSIRRLPVFQAVSPSFFERLGELRFQGDLWSVPEGTVVFPNEPLIRIEAALPEAQWVETLLLASIGYPTMVATKAARVVDAAGGRPIHDFGLRRCHGLHAGMLAARAAYLAGCEGTSNVAAAATLGIPCSGTMAHSWVQAFQGEPEAFSVFSRVFPDSSTLLIDTYDVHEGARHAAAVEPAVGAVRIDSGDLLASSIAARAELNSCGRSSVKIIVSGDLDETKIAGLLSAGAPIDAFGVGTELVASRDSPVLSLVYKLVALEGQGRVKLSPGKQTYPFAKQIYRQHDVDGTFSGDLVTRDDETGAGEALLKPVVLGGRLVSSLPRLAEVRAYHRQHLVGLPDRLRGIAARGDYPVEYSDTLRTEARRLGVGRAEPRPPGH